MQSLMADEYTVAVRAHYGVDYAIKRWQPTIDVLNKEIPQHYFNLLPVLDLQEISVIAGKGEFDFLLTNPSSYVEVKNLYGARALVTLNRKRGHTSQDRFGSVIFTHVSNKDILNIQDLEDKTLIAVSNKAFGGWRVALLEMLELGFDAQSDVKEIMFTKSKTHREVVSTVYSGGADAGVVRTGWLEQMEADGNLDMRYIRVLNNQYIFDFPFFLSTRLYPEWPFSVLKHVPDKDANLVSDTLLKIRKESVAAKSAVYIGWVKSRDYSSVQNLMIKLKNR
ncbi:MAG: hypothetical protein DIZ80_03695 [endosymbiont of Galathealinum brachiosum]|uniref:Phosphate ABC transporter substrate-binding protein n=1 Tax=endosymbiont of Galathealinum brachiosum TaxID=2200906 RepID=A0A370DI66_9GAMM|nr:MAG: hypothetical protein DIZ80_03695 [endosymbiont of Galathealinum brachiosum]